MEEIINQLVFEATHQVEKTTAVDVRSHCTDDGKGLYTIAAEIQQNGHTLDVFIGQDAINFLTLYKESLEK